MRSAGQVAVSLGVLGLGTGAAAVTATLPSEGGYAGIGPNFLPAVVSSGLIVLGLWLSAEAFTRGWQNAPSDDPGERGEHAFDAGAFLWITAGLLAHMALVGWAGFVVAAALLFVFVARGFGSAAWMRNSAIGLALGLAVFLFFVRLLNVNLPAGWLGFLLGGAGI